MKAVRQPPPADRAGGRRALPGDVGVQGSYVRAAAARRGKHTRLRAGTPTTGAESQRFHVDCPQHRRDAPVAIILHRTTGAARGTDPRLFTMPPELFADYELL